jgi:hypothetical protein
LPVVCLDIGGPGIFVDNTCGRVLPTHGVSPRALVCNLAGALEELRDPVLRRQLGMHARERVRAWSWDMKVESVGVSSWPQTTSEWLNPLTSEISSR